MNTKEELKRKFNLETYGIVTDYDRKKLWEFFWSEIEAREQNKNEIISQDSRNVQTLLDRLSILESTLEAAEKVIERSSYDWNKGHSGVYLEYLEKYQKLKTKSQS